MRGISLLFSLAVALLGRVESFAPRASATRSQTSWSRSPTSLSAIRCEEKYYQLEEMEDQDSCTTELFLKYDRTVEFGDTDGPKWRTAVGSWQVAPGTNDFTMEIVRTFSAGKGNTDIGEFDYAVKRQFKGEMTKVGESVGITGTAIAVVDDNSASSNGQEQEVGFFNMIDATDERVGDDKRV